MTNKEIAEKVAGIAFDTTDNSPDRPSFALQLLIETLNNPMKYSKGTGYLREDMEKAILDLLNDKRFNGVHFMDLSEPMKR